MTVSNPIQKKEVVFSDEFVFSFWITGLNWNKMKFRYAVPIARAIQHIPYVLCATIV